MPWLVSCAREGYELGVVIGAGNIWRGRQGTGMDAVTADHMGMQTGFVDNFLKIYRSFDLQPGSISVEITESYLVSDIGASLKKLNVLRSNGIDIHLDDFGTGYSSFNYLSVLPISTIKIDQSFVRDILDNHVDRLITKTIVDICKNLKLASICEGVEKPNQLELVRELGCDIIQGYVISRSVGDEVARDMIEHYKYVPPVVEEPAEEAPTEKSGKSLKSGKNQ